MRILIVSLRGPTLAARSGGAQAYARAIGGAWAREGHAVTLVCAQERLASGERLPAREVVDGIQVYRVGSPSRRVGPLLSAVRAHAPGADAVVENLMAAPLALPLWLPHLPLVALKHHVHGARGGWAARAAAALDRTLLPGAYRRTPLVVPSRRTAEAVRRLGLDAPIHVLPPPLAAPEASGAPRAARPTVLYLGALHLGRKRVDDLIEAFRLVSREVPDARLVIAGDGPDRATLERRARGLPVTFRGHVTEAEKARLYAQAWVLASPSAHEGFGITWIEAGASGVPLVGYRLDGLDTVDAASSRLVASGDVAALARELAAVLTDADLRQRLSDGARANAARFTSDATSRAILALVRAEIAAKALG